MGFFSWRKRGRERGRGRQAEAVDGGSESNWQLENCLIAKSVKSELEYVAVMQEAN